MTETLDIEVYPNRREGAIRQWRWRIWIGDCVVYATGLAFTRAGAIIKANRVRDRRRRWEKKHESNHSDN